MNTSAKRRNRTARRGMVAVMTAVLLPIIIGTMALAFDGGLMYLQRRKAQSVADAAALAGAYHLLKGNNSSEAQSAAQSAAMAVAQQNGMPITTSQVDVSQSGYVKVSVNGTQARFFSGLWGQGSLAVDANAKAVGATVPYSKDSILVLKQTGTSVTLSGTTQIADINGPIVVNSTSSAAILSSGNNSISAPELDLSGNILYSGHNPNNAAQTKYGQPFTPDPLASVQPPDPSTLTTQRTSPINLTSSTSMTLNPGVYNGGFNMSGQSSITLNPGVYYINGGGINMSGGASITGNGVFIYNTGGGAINLSGTGNISLNPMTSGAYAGITVFQDRNSTVGANMSGGSNINNTGTFYFPNAQLNLTGTTSVGVIGAQFIVNTLAFSGNCSIKVNYDNSVASKSSFGLVQ